MAKNMKSTQSNNNMTMYWVLVIVLVILAVFLYKKSDKFSRTKYTTDDTKMMEEQPIQDTSDLDETDMELDETDIDAQLDVELNMLEDDAQAIQ